MQKLAVMVTSAPHSNLTATALDYIQTAVSAGVEVIGVFFYQDGVLNASKHLTLPSDEFQAFPLWQKLHKENQLPLYLCISAAQKRGLSDEINESNGQNTSNINDIFTVAGLGELVTLTCDADKMVQF